MSLADDDCLESIRHFLPVFWAKNVGITENDLFGYRGPFSNVVSFSKSFLYQSSNNNKSAGPLTARWRPAGGPFTIL